MSKKAQVTVFIILGIIIVFAVAAITQMEQSRTRKTIAQIETAEFSPSEALEIDHYIRACLEIVAVQGWATTIEPKKELNNFIASRIPGCLKDFEEFRKQGFNFTQLAEMQATTYFDEQILDAVLNYSLRVEKGKTIHEFEQFHVTVPWQKPVKTPLTEAKQATNKTIAAKPTQPPSAQLQLPIQPEQPKPPQKGYYLPKPSPDTLICPSEFVTNESIPECPVTFSPLFDSGESCMESDAMYAPQITVWVSIFDSTEEADQQYRMEVATRGLQEIQGKPMAKAVNPGSTEYAFKKGRKAGTLKIIPSKACSAADELAVFIYEHI